MLLSALLPQFPEFSMLEAVITWIAIGGGSAYLVGRLFAFLVENVPAWEKVPSAAKLAIGILASGLLALAANAVLGYTELLGQLQPYYQIAVAAIIAWLSSQKALMEVKTKHYGVRYG